MSESSIKIEVTGEAATALAKLPELIHQSTRHWLERQELSHRLDREQKAADAREDRLREEAEQELLERRAAEADERRQQHIVSVLGIVAELVKSYLSGKEEADEPAGRKKCAPEPPQVSQSMINRLYTHLQRLPTGSPLPLPVGMILENVARAEPEWLDIVTVANLGCTMRIAGLADAAALVLCLGEDPAAFPNAVKVLNAALDLFGTQPPPTQDEKCLPVSTAEFVEAVYTLASKSKDSGADTLEEALSVISGWTLPYTWDHPDQANTRVVETIDRYLSGPIPAKIRQILDDNTVALGWLMEATMRLRYLKGEVVQFNDADCKFQELVHKLAGSEQIVFNYAVGHLPITDPPPELDQADYAVLVDYLNNPQKWHPSITESLLRPDNRDAYEWLERIVEQEQAR